MFYKNIGRDIGLVYKYFEAKTSDLKKNTYKNSKKTTADRAK